MASSLSVLTPQLQALFEQAKAITADGKVSFTEAMSIFGITSGLLTGLAPILADRNKLRAEIIASLENGVEEVCQLTREQAVPFVADKILDLLGV